MPRRQVLHQQRDASRQTHQGGSIGAGAAAENQEPCHAVRPAAPLPRLVGKCQPIYGAGSAGRHYSLGHTTAAVRPVGTQTSKQRERPRAPTGTILLAVQRLRNQKISSITAKPTLSTPAGSLPGSKNLRAPRVFRPQTLVGRPAARQFPAREYPPLVTYTVQPGRIPSGGHPAA